MNITDIPRIHWACRRGMKEIDLLIMPFFQHCYEMLTDQQKQAFVQLLAYQDRQLFSWLMNQSQPDDQALLHIIQLIQQRNTLCLTNNII